MKKKWKTEESEPLTDANEEVIRKGRLVRGGVGEEKRLCKESRRKGFAR
jgi:hypothetical protein